MAEQIEKIYTEIKIPVPWGHIAGKVWGNPCDEYVLAVHGKQDNCGAFDRLIKLLNRNYYIVAIDLPGHGFSSHFPSGLPVNLMDYIICILRVIKHFNWRRFKFLGHSLGGQIGIFFSSLYPENVERLIVIDHIAPSYVPKDRLIDNIREQFDIFMKMDSRLNTGTPPVYTYQQALEKLTNRDSVLTNESAEIILKRSLVPVPNGYRFCMDQRLKLSTFPSLTNEMMVDFLNNLKCPTLFIFSTERYEPYRNMFSEAFECIANKSNVTITVAEGNHDLHQNHPERVADLINEFFSKQRNKL